MCGFAGFVGFEGLNDDPVNVARNMANAIAHRGPDGAGTWVAEDAEVALAHRRLSIIDLSDAGAQPLSSSTGRFVIAFNGEIYNYEEIRASLEASGHRPPWRGHSDTEVLVEAAEAWGLSKALECSVGMFALALFDRAHRRLYLARDRMGEKPLYYGRVGRSFAFASEIKALTCLPHWRGEIDCRALALYMRYNNVPAPFSIYKGVQKLEPGSIVIFDLSGEDIQIKAFWDASNAVHRGKADPFLGTIEDATNETERLLIQAIRGQMISDVPLGAFLSGGVDSSAIVALMQSLSPRPVKTFSIGFCVPGYDEAQHAKAVAKHLNTDHTELYLTEADALEVVPCLPNVYSEPFSDSSQIPTLLVSKLARQHVTVALTGDGGDELFGGYTRHSFAKDHWPRLSAIPHHLREAVAAAIGKVTPNTIDLLIQKLDVILPRQAKVPRAGEQAHKLARSLQASSLDDLYLALTSHWDREDVVIGQSSATNTLPSHACADLSPMRTMMCRDLLGYLHNDVLHKVDRAAMSVGLETRVPMLDHRLVEFSWRLPEALLGSGAASKLPLRRLLDRYMPARIIDRPKMGFGVPIGSWLRGALRDWAEGLLSEETIRQQGFFDPKVIRQAWSEHQDSARDRQHDLWNVLMFQAWYASLTA